MTDPTPPSWGQVVGRFALIYGDGPDVDPSPDLIPISGTVTLTPQVPSVRLVQPDSPVTLVTTPIVCTIGSDGLLKGPDGTNGVRVMASRAAGIVPTAVQYRATFSLNGSDSWPLDPQPTPFLFEVPEGGVVDLADVMPQSAVPAYLEVVSHEDRDTAVAAASEATAAMNAAVAAAAAVPRWWSGTQEQFLELGTYEADRLYVVTA